MRFPLLFIFLFGLTGWGTLMAQTNAGLVAYYSFDACSGADDSGNNSNGLLFGAPLCACGVVGQALQLDGLDDYVLIGGPVNAFLENNNFTIALFVKPLGTTGVDNLFSKSDTCTLFNSMVVKTLNATSRYDIKFTESIGLGHQLIEPYGNACWQHLVITFATTTLKVYVNGQLRQTSTLGNTPDLDNGGAFTIGSGECVGVDGSGTFEGLVDEVYIYSRALDEEEVLEMYDALAPDRIITQDAIIFSGQTVNTFVTNSCATDILWQPSLGVSDSSLLEPVLSPTVTTNYLASFTDEFGCSSFDSLLIEVLDPDSFPCDRILLPTAFTPNADGLNDGLRISNAPVIDQLLAFEIYDRWGNRMFFTDDLNGTWDGTYAGSAANAGTYLWRARYVCNGRENVAMGEVTLIR